MPRRRHFARKSLFCRFDCFLNGVEHYASTSAGIIVSAASIGVKTELRTLLKKKGRPSLHWDALRWIEYLG
jgi:hypothetical protein